MRKSIKIFRHLFKVRADKELWYDTHKNGAKIIKLFGLGWFDDARLSSKVWYFTLPFVTFNYARINSKPVAQPTPIRQWHGVHEFPSPGIPLLVQLDDGTERKAIRPDYVATYKSDPNYRDPDTDEHIRGVVKWAIY
ncbi:MAG: hypothetical protein ACRBB6_04465 [Neptuniibacter sp.]